MERFRATTQLFGKAAAMACGLLLSFVCYGQSDSTQPTSRPFIFSKYQLPTQTSATISFFSAPLKPSPYKIHYKIKTLTFPSDPDHKPKRFNLIDAIISGYLEGKDNEENQNNFLMPVKKN